MDVKASDTPVTCPALHDISGGVRVSIHTPTPTVVLFACRTGFRLCSGDLRRVCLDNGTWSGEAATCLMTSSGWLMTRNVPLYTTAAVLLLFLLIFLPVDFVVFVRRKSRQRSERARRQRVAGRGRPTGLFVNSGLYREVDVAAVVRSPAAGPGTPPWAAPPASWPSRLRRRRGRVAPLWDRGPGVRAPRTLKGTTRGRSRGVFDVASAFRTDIPMAEVADPRPLPTLYC